MSDIALPGGEADHMRIAQRQSYDLVRLDRKRGI